MLSHTFALELIGRFAFVQNWSAMELDEPMDAAPQTKRFKVCWLGLQRAVC